MVDEEVLNSKEAAEFLKLNKNTLFKLARENKIPVQRVGRQWRFSKQALIKWLEIGQTQEK